MPYKDREKQRSYLADHYLRNKKDYLARARKWDVRQKKIIGKFLVGYLSAHPCVDCGESDIVVLEFDHRDRGTKEFCIGGAFVKKCSIKTVEAEVAKCDVRCANCHRRKTTRENGGYRLFLNGSVTEQVLAVAEKG